MSRGSTLILLGLVTLLMPFSGLPIAARTFFFVICGATVLGIGASVRARDARALQVAPMASPSLPTSAPEAPREISPL